MAEGSECHWQVAVSSTLVSCPGIFPLLDGLCWSPERENLDLQIKIYIQYTTTESMGIDFWLQNIGFVANMTTFVESVGTEPPRDHPPASLLFSASQGHTDLCLLPGLVLNPKGHCNKNWRPLEDKNHTKTRQNRKTKVTKYSPKILCCDLLFKQIKRSYATVHRKCLSWLSHDHNNTVIILDTINLLVGTADHLSLGGVICWMLWGCLSL